MMRVGKVLLPILLSSALLSAEYNWSSYADLTARSNGYRRGVGVTGVVPLYQNDCSHLFAQGLAGRYWDVWSLQLGGGYRRFFGSRFAAGINAFLDYAHTDHHQAYGQFGIGGEFIGPCWVVRANGYVPFSRRRVVDRRCDTSLIPSGNSLVCSTDERFLREFVYRGFDLEASYGLDVWCGTVWGTAGYFYFEGRGVRDVQGPRLRLEYRLNDLFGWCGAVATVGGEYEYNRVNRSYGSAVVSLRIPIGCPGRAMRCCSQVSVLRQMGDRVRRNEAIFIRTGRGHRTGGGDLVFLANGEPMGFFVAAPDGVAGVAGTLSEPTTLEAARERANPGDIIFVMAGDGTVVLRETMQLSDGQLLLGSGVAHTTPRGRLVAPVTSQLPIVEWQGGSTPMTELSGGTKVAGIEFSGGGTQAIVAGRDVRDVILERNRFVKGACAISLTNVTRPIVANNVFSELDQGIVIQGLHGASVMRENRFDGLQGSSLSIVQSAGQAELDVRRNRVKGGGGFAFDTSAGDLQLGLFHNTLSDVVGDGLVVKRSGSGLGRLELRAMHNVLSDVSGTAIHLVTEGRPTAAEDESPFVFDIWTNRMQGMGRSGIHVEHCGELRDLLMEGCIRDNTVGESGLSGGDAIRLDSDMWGQGSLVVDVARNQIEKAHGSAIGAIARAGSAGSFHLTLESNRDSDASSAGPTYIVKSEPRFSGAINFDLQGNSSDREGCGVRVVSKSGAVVSKQVAWAIASANSSLSFEQEGHFGLTDQLPDQPSWPEREKK